MLAMLANSETLIALPDGVALHARPAAVFVRTAMRFQSHIVVAANGREADAKSILSVLGLGATAGATLRVSAAGEDAAEALDALAACLAGIVE
jgi:phosphotransferase system HPr (HPr) family protein